MAVNVKTLRTAGLAKVKWGVRNSSGVFIGSSTTAPTAGNQTGSSLARLYGAKDFPFTPNEPEIVNTTGDDGGGAQFQFNPIELPRGVMTTEMNDMNFAATAMGLIAEDLGGFSFLGMQPSNVSYSDLVFITDSQARDRATGATMHYGYIVLNVNAYYLGHSGMAERGEGSFRWSLTANKSSIAPWGLAFADADYGDSEFVVLEYTSPYELNMDAWVLDGTETEFNLSGNIATDAESNIIVYANGVAQEWQASSATGAQFYVTEGTPDTITLGAAGTSGHIVVALYGIQ